MAKAVSRNDPCPCGSGKKYKRCCIGKQTLDRKRLILPLIVAAVALGGAAAVGVFHGVKAGLGVGLAGLTLALIIYVAQNSNPSGKGRGGASDINFGR